MWIQTPTQNERPVSRSGYCKTLIILYSLNTILNPLEEKRSRGFGVGLSDGHR
jgi:hypothetical protein